MSKIDSNTEFVDPVSHVRVERDQAEGRTFYNGTEYLFASRTNKSVFDENPQVWVSTPHVSETSANYITDDSDTR